MPTLSWRRTFETVLPGEAISSAFSDVKECGWAAFIHPTVQKTFSRKFAPTAGHNAVLDERREERIESHQIARPGAAFLSAHDQINLFHLRRDHVTAADHRAFGARKFQVWAEICSTGWQ
jgi:hypothetical protein